MGFTDFWDMVQDEIRRMTDKNTGLISTKYTVSRRCPVCDRSQKKELFRKFGFRYVLCRRCGMIFNDPVFKPSALQRMYETSKSFAYCATLMSSEAEKRRETNSLLIVKKVVKLKKTKTKRWLDIGCGYGALLKIAHQNGFEVYGVEPSIDCQKKLKKLNIIAKPELTSTSFLHNYFDVISLKQVIEHLFDPKDTVRLIYKMLKPGGLCWITTPNTSGFGMQLMKGAHPSYQRGHINMFNIKTMKQLLKQQGFKHITISTYSLKLLHIISFLKGKKDVREDVFKIVDKLPKEGGLKRKFYYRIIIPFINFFVKLLRKGDYIEVYAYK